MKPKKPLPPAVLATAADMVIAGTATRRSLQKIGVPEKQYPALAAAADDTLKQFRHNLSVRLEDLILALVSKLQAEHGKLATGQLPVAIGILTDKHKALTEAGHPSSQHLHLHLGSDDRTGAIAALLGKHGERLRAPGS